MLFAAMNLQQINALIDSLLQRLDHERRGGTADLHPLSATHFRDKAIMIGAVGHDGPVCGQKLVLIGGETNISKPEDHKSHRQWIVAADHRSQRSRFRHPRAGLELSGIGDPTAGIVTSATPQNLGRAISMLWIDDHRLPITTE